MRPEVLCIVVAALADTESSASTCTERESSIMKVGKRIRCFARTNPCDISRRPRQV